MLVTPSAVTHANDMSQRYIPLAVAKRRGGLRLTAPAGAAIAAPGYHMLFLINDRGVPSVAKFVRLAEPGCAASTPRANGARLDPARLGRTRSAQRRGLKRARRVTKGSMDNYCVKGDGTLRVAYPTKRLTRRLKASLRRRVRGRAVLVLTSSPAFSLNGIRRGDTTALVSQTLRGARSIRIGATTWYLARGRKTRLVVKVQGGTVRELGIADKRLTGSRTQLRRFLTAW